MKNYYLIAETCIFCLSEYLDAADFKNGASDEKKSSKFLTNIAN
jgi:hypothetical protein